MSSLALLIEIEELVFDTLALRAHALRSALLHEGVVISEDVIQREHAGATVCMTLDALPVHEPLTMHFPPERDTSVYGHGQTVIRYMRHFQHCLDADEEPSPGVVDGAKSVAVGAAAWESVRTGRVAKVASVE